MLRIIIRHIPFLVGVALLLNAAYDFAIYRSVYRLDRLAVIIGALYTLAGAGLLVHWLIDWTDAYTRSAHRVSLSMDRVSLAALTILLIGIMTAFVIALIGFGLL